MGYGDAMNELATEHMALAAEAERILPQERSVVWRGVAYVTTCFTVAGSHYEPRAGAVTLDPPEGPSRPPHACAYVPNVPLGYADEAIRDVLSTALFAERARATAREAELAAEVERLTQTVREAHAILAGQHVREAWEAPGACATRDLFGLLDRALADRKP